MYVELCTGDYSMVTTDQQWPPLQFLSHSKIDVVVDLINYALYGLILNNLHVYISNAHGKHF